MEIITKLSGGTYEVPSKIVLKGLKLRSSAEVNLYIGSDLNVSIEIDNLEKNLTGVVSVDLDGDIVRSIPKDTAVSIRSLLDYDDGPGRGVAAAISAYLAQHSELTISWLPEDNEIEISLLFENSHTICGSAPYESKMASVLEVDLAKNDD